MCLPIYEDCIDLDHTGRFAVFFIAVGKRQFAPNRRRQTAMKRQKMIQYNNV